MKTEHRLAQALKEMLAKKPLDEISVTALSEQCGVSRKTFYYHFHDIYDLLTLVFLSEKIDGIQSVKTTNDVIDRIYAYYEKNSAFVDAVINSATRELLQEFIYNNVYQAFTKLTSLILEVKKITPNERKQIIRFYTSGFSSAIVFYLTNKKVKSFLGLKTSLKFIGEDFLKDAITKLAEDKEEK